MRQHPPLSKPNRGTIKYVWRQFPHTHTHHSKSCLSLMNRREEVCVCWGVGHYSMFSLPSLSDFICHLSLSSTSFHPSFLILSFSLSTPSVFFCMTEERDVWTSVPLLLCWTTERERERDTALFCPSTLPSGYIRGRLTQFPGNASRFFVCLAYLLVPMYRSHPPHHFYADGASASNSISLYSTARVHIPPF